MYRGQRGLGEVGEGKKLQNESNFIILYKCMTTQMVCSYSMYKQKQHVSHLFTIKINLEKLKLTSGLEEEPVCGQLTPTKQTDNFPPYSKAL